MNTPASCHRRRLPQFLLPRCWPAIVALLSTVLVHAQSVGTIEGRIFNSSTGEYLEKARITVEGVALETFSEAGGHFRLSNVPAGRVELRAFYTGLPSTAVVLTLEAGQIVQRDLGLTRQDASAQATSSVVKLSEFVVSNSREMTGAAVAINEQRFAPNIRNVVSADEFGTVPDGSVGEFMKFLPGITMRYEGGDVTKISMGGVPPANVPVTVNGFSLASLAYGNGTSREVELLGVSMNNIARIDISHSPTPESQGSALAGSVDYKPRSAFERSKPLLKGSAYVMMNDAYPNFQRTPFPKRTSTLRANPGFDLSYSAPVTKTFGFTLSADMFTKVLPIRRVFSTWRGSGFATNGTSLPDTTADKPYLTDYQIAQGNNLDERHSFGATLDFKPNRTDQISVGYLHSTSRWLNNQHNTFFFVNSVAPGNFGPSFTRGTTGAGEVRTNNALTDMRRTTNMFTLSYRHDGTLWKAEAGAAHSRATNSFLDGGKGYLSNIQGRRTGVTVSFDENATIRPGVITVTDTAGRPIDPYDANTYAISAIFDTLRDHADIKRSAYANLRRDLFWKVPVTVKGGLDLVQTLREARSGNRPITYYGKDKIVTTTPTDPRGSDDGAAIMAHLLSERTGGGIYGFPNAQIISGYKAGDLFSAQPDQFLVNEAGFHTNMVNGSKHIDELISAGYVRADLQFFNNRLKLIGGVRAEQTNVKAQGPLTEPSRNYARDAQGKVILDGGRPRLVTTDPLQINRLTRIDRGLHTEKEYLRWFPSLNASFQIRENLIARAAYYHSVGRPDYDQYAGGLTLPNLDNGPGPANFIAINNPEVKAWEARSTKVRLEYYFEGIGQVSVGAFQRNITNFFGTTRTTAKPEFLAEYGLDPLTYGAYDVSTQFNVSSPVRMTGFEFDYKQVLTFLPHWARGFQVFGNVSTLRTLGEQAASFAGFIPVAGNWGISLTRQNFNLRTNWNYRGRNRLTAIAPGRGIESGTFNWDEKRVYMDVLGEYYFGRRYTLFASLRNIRSTAENFTISNPRTPAGSQFRSNNNFGSFWTFGIKGSF